MGLVPRDAVSSDYPFEHHVLHHVPLHVDDRQFPVAVRRVRTLVVLFGDRASSRFGFYDDAVCVNVITTAISSAVHISSKFFHEHPLFWSSFRK